MTVDEMDEPFIMLSKHVVATMDSSTSASPASNVVLTRREGGEVSQRTANNDAWWEVISQINLHLANAAHGLLRMVAQTRKHHIIMYAA